jgi:hypothetical protein
MPNESPLCCRNEARNISQRNGGGVTQFFAMWLAEFLISFFVCVIPKCPRFCQRAEESRENRLSSARDPSLRLKNGCARDDDTVGHPRSHLRRDREGSAKSAKNRNAKFGSSMSAGGMVLGRSSRLGLCGWDIDILSRLGISQLFPGFLLNGFAIGF